MIRKGHTIRVGMLLVVCIIVYFCVLGRLFWVQIIKRDFFNGLARHQYLMGVFGTNPRESIEDRYGHPLVVNKEVFSAFIVPHNASQDNQVLLEFLKRYYPIVFERLTRHPDRHFFWLERRLSPERKSWLAEQNISEIHFALESVRYYPYAELAHVLGFTDIDNRGIAGLELAFDKRLAGEAAEYRQAKDARTKRYYFDQTIKKQGISGRPVQITIDHELQFLLYQDLAAAVESFQAKQGAVIVMEPFSGEILSMVSYPSFNANDVSVVDLSSTKNVAVTECFEPGSIMKTFSALAGLEEGVVDYNEIFDCEGKITKINGFRVENWKNLGVMPFFEAVKNSSNVVAAKVGLRLGPKLYDHLVRLGFGQKTYLGFPGERPGFVNPPNKWSRSSVMVMTFGYEVTMTLLQAARAMAVVANGGFYIEPILQQEDKGKNVNCKRIYSKKSIDEIAAILELVGARYPLPGFKLKGKTGTARMVVDKVYSTKKHTYTFAGFVTKDDYRRVIVTFIRETEKTNLWAADVVAPLAQKVAERLAIHDFNKGILKNE